MILLGSVRLNVAPMCVKSDAAIMAVLARVGLLNIIRERGNLDVEIAASSLSRGQQQLLALARAILSPGSILVLDEATSNVDIETDAVMQRVLLEEFGGRTIVHRTNTIMGSDVIAVMEDGRLAEVRAPNELLIKRGNLSRLVRGYPSTWLTYFISTASFCFLSRLFSFVAGPPTRC